MQPGDEPELNTLAFEKGKEIAFALRELLQGMDLEPIVSDRVSLDDLPKTIDRLREGAVIKAVVLLDGAADGLRRRPAPRGRRPAARRRSHPRGCRWAAVFRPGRSHPAGPPGQEPPPRG